MFRRSRRRADSQPDPDVAAEAIEGQANEAVEDPSQGGLDETSVKPDRPNGPWDADEVDLNDPAVMADRIDLGGLVIRGEPGMQLQLQVDESSGVVTSALVVIEDAAVQMLAVAAPRSTTMWPETRAQIAADASRRGGTATEADGPMGAELHLAIPVKLPDGSGGVQPSRMVGIDGPRWLLRATFLGRAALEDEAFEQLARVVRNVVVVRGGQPMPPGDVIPLRLPKEASTAEASAEEQRPTLDDLAPGPTITEIR